MNKPKRVFIVLTSSSAICKTLNLPPLLCFYLVFSYFSFCHYLIPITFTIVTSPTLSLKDIAPPAIDSMV